jgi:hypothetical protein
MSVPFLLAAASLAFSVIPPGIIPPGILQKFLPFDATSERSLPAASSQQQSSNGREFFSGVGERVLALLMLFTMLSFSQIQTLLFVVVVWIRSLWSRLVNADLV